MSKLKWSVLLIGLTVVLTSAVVVVVMNDATPSWVSKQVYNYHLDLPSGWTTITADGHNFSGQMMRHNWSVKIFNLVDQLLGRKSTNESEYTNNCDESKYTADLKISSHSRSDYFNLTGEDLTVMAVENYLKSPRGVAGSGQILSERDLGNGTIVVVGTGRYGSGPCMGFQYQGFVVKPGQSYIQLYLIMDEERRDIADHIFNSIRLTR